MAYRDDLDAARAHIAALETALAKRGSSSSSSVDAVQARAERDAALARIDALALRVRELEATIAALSRDHAATLAGTRAEQQQAKAEVEALEARVRELVNSLDAARTRR